MSKTPAPEAWRPDLWCRKCGGAGWLWGYELDEPDEDTAVDTMTKYSCDGEGHTPPPEPSREGEETAR